MNRAIDDAIRNAENLLFKSLSHAVNGDANGVFRRLLVAAAEYHADFLTASEWAEAYKGRWGEKITPQSVGSSSRRFVSNKDDLDTWRDKGVSPIFVRESSGLYRFHDPRMPSFIRLALSGAANDFVNLR